MCVCVYVNGSRQMTMVWVLHIDLRLVSFCGFQKQDVQLCHKVSNGPRKCHEKCTRRFA